VDTLKAARIWVYGLDAEGERDYDEVEFAEPLAIVAGAEGRGLGRLVRERCDALIRIPLYGHVESLNVSAAVAVVLMAARRARERAKRATPLA
jgi:23S rRNA (guanosine2251-2'-O)-methyltransferase